MRIQRRFTKSKDSPYADLTFRRANSEIRDPDGSLVFKLDDIEVPESWSAVACDVLAQKFPYNRKIDNFMEVDVIENVAFSSIQDEEVLGKTRPVGIMQLYNRVASDILQDDLVRIHYIRKLIGSMMIKCELYSITLELIVGMSRHQEIQ